MAASLRVATFYDLTGNLLPMNGELEKAPKDFEMQYRRAIEFLKGKGHKNTHNDASKVVGEDLVHGRAELSKVLDLHKLASELYPDGWRESERDYEESIRGRKT